MLNIRRQVIIKLQDRHIKLHALSMEMEQSQQLVKGDDKSTCRDGVESAHGDCTMTARMPETAYAQEILWLTRPLQQPRGNKCVKCDLTVPAQVGSLRFGNNAKTATAGRMKRNRKKNMREGKTMRFDECMRL